MEELYGDPPAVWRPWTTDLRGGLDCGHHMAEEASEELAEQIGSFLAEVVG
jgi:haloacetate dehalogenase